MMNGFNVIVIDSVRLLINFQTLHKLVNCLYVKIL
jgi:hypothetical protein